MCYVYDYGNERWATEFRNKWISGYAVMCYAFACNFFLRPDWNIHIYHRWIRAYFISIRIRSHALNHSTFQRGWCSRYPSATCSANATSIAVANERMFRPSIFIASLLNRPSYVSVGRTIKLIAVCSPWAALCVRPFRFKIENHCHFTISFSRFTLSECAFVF